MGIFNKVYKKPVQLKELLNEQSLSENKKEELKGGILKEDKSKEAQSEYSEQTKNDIQQYNELLEKFDILQQQQQVLYGQSKDNLKDQYVVLDRQDDKNIIQQLSLLRKYQYPAKTANKLNPLNSNETPVLSGSGLYNEQSSDYNSQFNNEKEGMSEITNDKGNVINNAKGLSLVINEDLTTTNQFVTVDNKGNPKELISNEDQSKDIISKKSSQQSDQEQVVDDVITNDILYFQDYEFQNDVAEQQILNNMSESLPLNNGAFTKDKFRNAVNSFKGKNILPDVSPCQDKMKWSKKLIWKLIINEDDNDDIAFLLIKFVLGPLEIALNTFLGLIHDIDILSWKPFSWVEYMCFQEEFQYDLAKKYDSMTCGQSIFMKNYKADDRGLIQFLKKRNFLR